MAYFEDLTPYSYGRETPEKNILNIGWLAGDKSFEKGEASDEFIKLLGKLIEEPVNLYRGLHHCEFCPPPIYEKIPNKVVSKVVRDCPSGNGEIRVCGSNGTVYVAPVLVHHYVTVHNYLPPKQFINAVLSKNA